jgi:sugar/nucleoside kinase (ribokinase family)
VGRRLDILAWGNPCHDIVVQVGELPAWGGKSVGSGWHSFGGGTEANVACTAARLGSRVALVGAVGNEEGAGALRDELVAYGVQVDTVQQLAGGRSSLSVVLVSPDGERVAGYVPMKRDRAAPGISGLAERLADAKCLYTMPYDIESFSEAVHTARGCKTLVAIDVEAAVARDPRHAETLISMSDIVFFNDDGFRAATGAEPTPAALKALFERSTLKAAAVTLGAEGAMAIDETGMAIRRAYKVRVADTTGAGDAFNGAFLHTWLKGEPLERCVSFGCATAACAVQAMGARGALPAVADVEALMASCESEGVTPC